MRKETAEPGDFALELTIGEESSMDLKMAKMDKEGEFSFKEKLKANLEHRWDHLRPADLAAGQVLVYIDFAFDITELHSEVTELVRLERHLVTLDAWIQENKDEHGNVDEEEEGFPMYENSEDKTEEALSIAAVKQRIEEEKIKCRQMAKDMQDDFTGKVFVVFHSQ